MSEQKFPSEVIDLPSEGRLYPKDSPLSNGKIEIIGNKLSSKYFEEIIGKTVNGMYNYLITNNKLTTIYFQLVIKYNSL